MCTVVFVVEFYLAVWPVGAESSVVNFFATYLSVPIFICCYIGYKVITLPSLAD
jgi:yeast amino acid transporter